jgi:hypothetical protein
MKCSASDQMLPLRRSSRPSAGKHWSAIQMLEPPGEEATRSFTGSLRHTRYKPLQETSFPTPAYDGLRQPLSDGDVLSGGQADAQLMLSRTWGPNRFCETQISGQSMTGSGHNPRGVHPAGKGRAVPQESSTLGKMTLRSSSGDGRRGKGKMPTPILSGIPLSVSFLGLSHCCKGTTRLCLACIACSW